MRLAISALALLMLFVTGCSLQGVEAGYGTPRGNDMNQGVQQLVEEGVHILTAWEQDGVYQVTVFDADADTKERIREILGQDVVIIDEEERFFIQGIISEITPDTNGFGRLVVEGEEESAIIFISQMTSIWSGDLEWSFENLNKGQQVKVWVVGPVLTSLPPQAGASKVIVD